MTSHMPIENVRAGQYVTIVRGAPIGRAAPAYDPFRDLYRSPFERRQPEPMLFDGSYMGAVLLVAGVSLPFVAVQVLDPRGYAPKGAAATLSLDLRYVHLIELEPEYVQAILQKGGPT